MLTTLFFKALEELGLISLWTSSFDTKLLCAQRFVRLFAYGSSTLILVSYLSALDISKTKIGLFMTLTLIGDTGLSFVFTIFADALGRKAILLLGAVLMIAAGAIFALFGNYWVLLIAAVIGVISPNGNEIGPFRAIEESTLAQITAKQNRGDIYAWYSLLGAAGSALGLGVCGWILDFLLKDLGWTKIKAYRAAFWAYAALGIVILCIVLLLSKKVEIKKEVPPSDESASSVRTGTEDEKQEEKKTSIFSKLPHFSRKSKRTVIKLCILFALDSFACSLAPLSWITFFFHDKFNLPDNKLGTIFFITSFVAALSMLPASSIARRLGNVTTMVFAHIPGAIFLALLPVSNSASLAITFLILRSSTQSMDTAPRSAFLAGIVEPHERTAMMGCVFFAKSASSTVGPTITGVLAGRGLLWVAFVVAGVLGVVYDLAVFAVFWRRERGEGEGEKGGDLESGGSARNDDTLEVRGRDEKGKSSLSVMSGDNRSEEKIGDEKHKDEVKSEEIIETGVEREKPIAT